MDRYWGAGKTLADFVKESSWQTSTISNGVSSPVLPANTSSMPWAVAAAAVKVPPPPQQPAPIISQSDHLLSATTASNFNYQTSTIGSWISPETNFSSSRSGPLGWNPDGSSKNDGAFDDGTAIWGNPIAQKAGIDWTEKESSSSPAKAISNSNSEKRIPKPEPAVSSLNGTEAWGAPVKSTTNSQQQQQQLQKQIKNDNSGNIYGSKSINESNSWGESSSLLVANADQQLDSVAYSPATTPSRDLLKQMVYQIQLAVQAGHLNAHILNQPLSTPTLQLVYQLLQQIKTLHQLQEIQQRAGLKLDMSSPSNMDLQIERIRQNIFVLQKAITQQQASSAKNDNPGDSNNLIKQQQHQQEQQQHQQEQQQLQQQANSFSYATISKLSTNSKVPSNNIPDIINNSNIDSFRRSNLIDTLSNSNSNSDLLRSAQANFEPNASIDKTLSSIIQALSAFPTEYDHLGKPHSTPSSSSSGGRPAPPPGLFDFR